MPLPSVSCYTALGDRLVSLCSFLFLSQALSKTLDFISARENTQNHMYLSPRIFTSEDAQNIYHSQVGRCAMYMRWIHWCIALHQ